MYNCLLFLHLVATHAALHPGLLFQVDQANWITQVPVPRFTPPRGNYNCRTMLSIARCTHIYPLSSSIGTFNGIWRFDATIYTMELRFHCSGDCTINSFVLGDDQVASNLVISSGLHSLQPSLSVSGTTDLNFHLEIQFNSAYFEVSVYNKVTESFELIGYRHYDQFYYEDTNVVVTSGPQSDSTTAEALKTLLTKNECVDRNFRILAEEGNQEINSFLCWFPGMICNYDRGHFSLKYMDFSCFDNDSYAIFDNSTLGANLGDIQRLWMEKIDTIVPMAFRPFDDYLRLYLSGSFSVPNSEGRETVSIGTVTWSDVDFIIENIDASWMELFGVNFVNCYGMNCTNLPNAKWVEYRNGNTAEFLDCSESAITYLNLEESEIGSWDGSGLPMNLLRLYLTDTNFLQDVNDSDLSYLTSLKVLDLENVPLTNWQSPDTKIPVSLTRLIARNTLLTSVDLIQNLQNLWSLDLDYNPGLSSVDIEDFIKPLPNLYSFKCRECGIFGTLNDEFFKLFADMSSAYLVDNNLYSPDLDFRYPRVFTEADFPNIHAFSPNLWNLTNAIFDLGQNPLQGYVPKYLADGSHVSHHIDFGLSYGIWGGISQSYDPEYSLYVPSHSIGNNLKILGMWPPVYNPFMTTTHTLTFYGTCSYASEIILFPLYPGRKSSTGREIDTKYQLGGYIVVIEFSFADFRSLSSLQNDLLEVHDDFTSSKYFHFSVNYCGASSQKYPLKTGNFCDPGYQLPEHSGTTYCQKCNRGKYSIGQKEPCRVCPVGTYQGLEGSESCNRCNVGKTTLFSGSTSQIQCICPENSFGPYGKEGSCTPCLGNAECPIGSIYPEVKPGYFINPENRSIVLQCIPSTACESTSLAETTCTEGYTGYLCGDCIPLQYYRLQHQCFRCGSQQMKIAFAIIILMFMLFFVVKMSTPGGHIGTGFKIMIGWIQIMALYPTMTNSWSEQLENLLGTISVANLDIDLISPSCSIETDYWTQWKIKLLIPVLAAVILLILFSVQTYLLKKYQKALFDISWEDIKSRSISIGVKADIDPYATSRFVYSYISIVNSLYSIILSTVIDPFNCAEQIDGTFTMVSNPIAKCYHDEWNHHYPVMIAALIIYTGIIPLCLLITLFYYRRELYSEKYQRYFGSLTKAYAPVYYYWDFVTILKKMLIFVASDFLARKLSSVKSQVFLVVIILLVFHILEQFLRPYRSKEYNGMVLLWSLVSILTLMSSFAFSSDSTVSSGEKVVFSWTLVIMFVGASCGSIAKLLSKRSKRSSISHHEDMKVW